MIEKTGWTIDEISSLTFKQIKLVLDGFSSLLPKKKTEQMKEPSKEEMELFNLTSGIERVIKKK